MMSKIDGLLDSLAEKGRHPRRTILEEVKRTGRRPVGFMPIYAPEEIIYAGGFLPVGMWGGDVEYQMSDRFLQSFTCSIMRANIELGMRGDYDMLTAVIIPFPEFPLYMPRIVRQKQGKTIWRRNSIMCVRNWKPLAALLLQKMRF